MRKSSTEGVNCESPYKEKKNCATRRQTGKNIPRHPRADGSTTAFEAWHWAIASGMRGGRSPCDWGRAQPYHPSALSTRRWGLLEHCILPAP